MSSFQHRWLLQALQDEDDEAAPFPPPITTGWHSRGPVGGFATTALTAKAEAARRGSWPASRAWAGFAMDASPFFTLHPDRDPSPHPIQAAAEKGRVEAAGMKGWDYGG